MSDNRRLNMIEARLALLEGGRDVESAPKWARPFLNRVPPGERLYRVVRGGDEWVHAFPSNKTMHPSGYIGNVWVNDESEASSLEKYVVQSGRPKVAGTQPDAAGGGA